MFFSIKLVAQYVKKKTSKRAEDTVNQSFLIICSLCVYEIDRFPRQVPNVAGVVRQDSLPLTKCYSLPVPAIPNSPACSLPIIYLILDPDKGNLTDCKANL